MGWMQEINVADGIKLPTGGEWIDVPGSPFQVMARGSDIMGTMYIRIRPAYAAYWNEFMSTKEAGGD
jgi:hypothetical protein